MTSVNAVIGAGYGDEGKGLMTDYLARQDEDTIVVRSNGGAQAGHTVTLPNGYRNVFSHIGSGTLAGNRTYLSEFFVSNPMLWYKEIESLKRYTDDELIPSMWVHPDSPLTTPYDMLLNMAFEQHRGDEKHGSCGVGFGETIERTETFMKLTVADLYTMSQQELYDLLDIIRNEYVPVRLWFELSDEYKSLLNNDNIIHNFIDVCEEFQKNFTLANYDVLKGQDIIFEGAQGLMLDQRHPYFPHVTRSNTGMKNVMSIINQVGGIAPADITVNYVTRAYTTRHGAGPLSNEMDIPFSVDDETNIRNNWQGSLRFAPLDFDVLYDTIQDDAQNYPATVNQKLAFTCADQVREGSVYVEDNTIYNTSRVHYIEKMVSMGDYVSYGPTHLNVRRTSDD